MLIPEKLNTIIRILLADMMEGKPSLIVAALAKRAGITSAMAKRLVLRLERSGYVSISRGIKLTIPVKLIKAWGYMYSIREMERTEFVAAERPQYVMLKISNFATGSAKKPQYAFTLFSAAEHISPYAAPSDTYLYVLKDEMKLWEQFFSAQKFLPTEKQGNIICLPVDKDYFEGVWAARNMKVVSLPQLYADLFSYGGRGEEAAEQIMELIHKKLKNV